MFAMDTIGLSSPATFPEVAFLDSLPVIHDVIRAVCIRGRVSLEEKEELTSSVLVKLISQDYRLFRQFRASDTPRTFLYTVVSRQLLDRRNREWGRWRASKCAKALGPAAIYLEQLVYRDGRPLGDAVTVVASTPGWALTSENVRSLYARLPQRTTYRRRAPLDDTGRLQLAGPEGTDALVHGQQRQDAARLREALERALRALTSEERRLLRWRFQEGVSVMDIAASTGEKPPILYRRYARLLKRLRSSLLAEGVTEDAIRSLLGQVSNELDALLRDACRSQ
jgi:RNA polymerase sigma factor (sigma-70 family)